MMVFSSPAGKKEALRTEIAWNALLREVRSANVSGLRAAQQPRKKRSRLEDGLLEDGLSVAQGQDKKVRCRRSSSPTFLDLSPPSASLDDVSFTFGRQHYTSISLPTLSKSSCGCSTGAKKFDAFSSYRCPCSTKSNRSFNATNNKRNSSSVRGCDAF